MKYCKADLFCAANFSCFIVRSDSIRFIFVLMSTTQITPSLIVWLHALNFHFWSLLRTKKMKVWHDETNSLYGKSEPLQKSLQESYSCYAAASNTLRHAAEAQEMDIYHTMEWLVHACLPFSYLSSVRISSSTGVTLVNLDRRRRAQVLFVKASWSRATADLFFLDLPNVPHSQSRPITFSGEGSSRKNSLHCLAFEITRTS